MKKIVLIVLALVVIAGAALFLNLNSVVKAIIEKAGTEALGTAVHVGGLDISLTDKSVRISRLSIANPPGFSAPNLLTTKAISVTLGDMTEQTVVIRDIGVDGMTVSYELKPGGSNFDALQKRIKSTATAEKPGDKTAGKKVIIGRLKITRAQLAPAVGMVKAPINLPDIILTNIGSKNSPATPVQVATQVMNKVMAVSTAAAIQSGLLNNPASKVLEKIQTPLKGLFSK